MLSQSSLFSSDVAEQVDPAGDLSFSAAFLGATRARLLFEGFRHWIPWEQRKVFVGGLWRDQPRLICWFGDRAYTYSKLSLQPRAFATVPGLAELARDVGEAAGVVFNTCLANYYRDGRDSIGMHSDDEPELGPEPMIASISLGATRTFKLARKDKSQRMNIALTGGSLLVMRGNSQRDWMHGIDKEPGSGPRVNLTFRRMA